LRWRSRPAARSGRTGSRLCGLFIGPERQCGGVHRCHYVWSHRFSRYRINPIPAVDLQLPRRSACRPRSGAHQIQLRDHAIRDSRIARGMLPEAQLSLGQLPPALAQPDHSAGSLITRRCPRPFATSFSCRSCASAGCLRSVFGSEPWAERGLSAGSRPLWQPMWLAIAA
jgi:hypothetical protein